MTPRRALWITISRSFKCQIEFTIRDAYLKMLSGLKWVVSICMNTCMEWCSTLTYAYWNRNSVEESWNISYVSTNRTRESVYHIYKLPSFAGFCILIWYLLRVDIGCMVVVKERNRDGYDNEDNTNSDHLE